MLEDTCGTLQNLRKGVPVMERLPTPLPVPAFADMPPSSGPAPAPGEQLLYTADNIAAGYWRERMARRIVCMPDLSAVR